MSLFKSIVGAVLPAVGTFFGGPVGGAIGTAVGGALSRNGGGASPAPTFTQTASAPMLAMGSLPSIAGRGVAGAAGFIAGRAVLGARTILRSANVYCRRHPAWCAQIGGTAAIASMIESGQLPPVRRRRGRGLSPRDLRSFRRVATLIRQFAPTARRVPTRALHVRRTGITHA